MLVEQIQEHVLSSTFSTLLVLVSYFIAGLPFSARWSRYTNSGKSFLMLVFPVHIALSLIGWPKVLRGVRNVIIALLSIWLFLMLTRS